jgi:hypothetical protein
VGACMPRRRRLPSSGLRDPGKSCMGEGRTSSKGENQACGSQHSTMAERGPTNPSGLCTGRRHEPFGHHATSS